MNKLFKYGATALVTLVAASCAVDGPEPLDSAVVMESVALDIDTDTEVRIYTDANGVQVLPMVAGESITLGYTTVPEDLSEVTFPKMVWSSSNEAVAVVDENGTVRAVSGGSTVISVTSEAINVVAVASINVLVAQNPVLAETITITDNSEHESELPEGAGLPSCYEGETMQLTATITPADATYKSVKWTSSDERIATVDPITGVVTGVKSGRVTITASALDAGSTVSAAHEIFIDAIINPLGIQITNIPADGSIQSLSDRTFVAEFNTEPAVCTRSLITWTSSDEDVATVSGGVVTYKMFGKVTITATCMDGEGSLPAGYAKTASFTLNIPAGYYDDVFTPDSWLWWESDTNGCTIEVRTSDKGESYLQITPGVQNASNWRGDFQRVPDAETVSAANSIPYKNNVTFLNRAEYPILCFRMDDVADKGAGNRSIAIDVNNGYVYDSGSTDRIWSGRLGGGGAQKWTKKYKCSDGSALLVYDLSTQSFQNGGMLPETGIAVFPNFKFVYADIRTFASADEASYRFFWFKTFKSENEMNTFLGEWSAETDITYSLEE